jgi:hypothetical protein
MIDMHEESRQPGLTWTAQEVVREVDHRAHLLVRITVRGGTFPHRAMGPFMRIVAGRTVVFPWFTEISGDSGALAGYFAVDLPGEGVIEYGYPGQPPRRVPALFTPEPVQRLDRARLPRDVVEVTGEFLEEKRGRQAQRASG